MLNFQARCSEAFAISFGTSRWASSDDNLFAVGTENRDMTSGEERRVNVKCNKAQRDFMINLHMKNTVSIVT